MHFFIASLFSLFAGVITGKRKRYILKKGFSDLLVYPRRSALVVFALVIGLWGVGTILVSYTVLKNDLTENYLRTSPAHVVITSDDFSNADLETLRSRSEVESAAFRDLSYLRVEAYPDKWLPLWLYGVDDFNDLQLATIFPESGEIIPPSGTIFIERDGQNQRVSNLGKGSVAKVRVGGEIKKLAVSGIVFDPGQPPSTQDAIIFAYTDMESFGRVTGEKTGKRMIIRIKNARTLEQVRVDSQKIAESLEARGVKIKEVEIPPFNEHPHQFQLNTLLMINGLIGALAFLMGAVLVSQLMGAILSQQIRQIGILKAIGATRFQVMEIYLFMILIFGVVSSVVAIPLAIFSGFGYARFVAGIINFDILTETLPGYIIWLMVSVGLSLPLLLSFPALLKGTKVSVYDALVDYGLGFNEKGVNDKPSRRFFFGSCFGSRFFSGGVLLAFRNTLRRKKRLFVTVATMMLGVAIFDTGFNVKQSLTVFLQQNEDSMRYDVLVVLKKRVAEQEALKPFKTLENLKRIETWSGGKGQLIVSGYSTRNRLSVVAAPNDTDLIKWDLIKGQWLGTAAEGVPEIVVNQAAYEELDFPVIGGVYQLFSENKNVEVRIIGVVKQFDRPRIYIDKSRYDQIFNPDNLVKNILFVAEQKDYDSVIDFKKEIESLIEPTGFVVANVVSQAEMSKIIFDHLNIILSILTFLALLVLFVSALGMGSATGINIMERTREIGVLRAIGATPAMILRLFTLEGMVVSVVGIALGLLLAWPLSVQSSAFFGTLIMGANTPLDFAFSVEGFIITIAITLLFGLIASALPAKRALRVSVREALAYE